MSVDKACVLDYRWIIYCQTRVSDLATVYTDEISPPVIQFIGFVSEHFIFNTHTFHILWQWWFDTYVFINSHSPSTMIALLQLAVMRLCHAIQHTARCVEYISIEHVVHEPTVIVLSNVVTQIHVLGHRMTYNDTVNNQNNERFREISSAILSNDAWAAKIYSKCLISRYCDCWWPNTVRYWAIWGRTGEQPRVSYRKTSNISST